MSVKKSRKPLPEWLKKSSSKRKKMRKMKKVLRRLKVNTVCESALCPNRGDCFENKTAAFMILGTVCTRNCRFCAVEKGLPDGPDPHEPGLIARAVEKLKLRHAVITSVSRDDLDDGGASQFAEVIEVVRENEKTTVEVLIPDFQGDISSLNKVVSAEPDIINHNLETVSELYSSVRPDADYNRSINLLKRVKEMEGDILTKSGIMLGLGESKEEVNELLEDLFEAGCDIVTLGQYIRPSGKQLPVKEFIKPKIFKEYKIRAEEMGFKYAASDPLVRSSFNAHHAAGKLLEK